MGRLDGQHKNVGTIDHDVTQTFLADEVNMVKQIVSLFFVENVQEAIESEKLLGSVAYDLC